MALGAAAYLDCGVHTFGPLSSRTSIPQLPEGAAEPQHCVMYDGKALVALELVWACCVNGVC